MKRILIMSILALVVMIGTAAAYGSTLYDENDQLFTSVQLAPGQSTELTFSMYGFLPIHYGVYNFTSNVTVYSGSGSPADLIFDAPASIVLDTGNKDITIMLTLDENAEAGSVYDFNVGYGIVNSQGTLYNVDEGGVVESIPEFPTVALPVAAIIGLAFFMQRRKEE